MDDNVFSQDLIFFRELQLAWQFEPKQKADHLFQVAWQNSDRLSYPSTATGIRNMLPSMFYTYKYAHYPQSLSLQILQQLLVPFKAMLLHFLRRTVSDPVVSDISS